MNLNSLPKRLDSTRVFFHDLWNLSTPYFRSDERRTAWTLLISIVALSLFNVYVSVVFNTWNSQFYDALQAMDQSACMQLLFTWRQIPDGGILGTNIMPGFCALATILIAVTVAITNLNMWLQMRWRSWLTTQFLDGWLADGAHYLMSLTHQADQTGTDNPDQRIADDVKLFVANTLSLTVDLLATVVTFASFITILWNLSGPIELFGVTIPGYMVIVALAYSVIGTWLTHLVGRPLSKLRFRQQRLEADFRYGLVRLRENSEGVTLYGGEVDEKRNLAKRFKLVAQNWWELMSLTKKLNTLTTGYGQIAIIFPFAVAMPRYFGGVIKLGGLMQISNAFGQVQGALSWLVSSYGSLAEWNAIVSRLATFQRAIDTARAANKGIVVRDSEANQVKISGLTLELPNGVKLLADENLTFKGGTSVVVTGASGSGKSTLFRAIFGIWPFGQGHVERPLGNARCLFVPQRSYIPLGSLRRVVSFPSATDAYSTESIEQALFDAGLAYLSTELDTEDNWAQRLSGGEQQRMALARVLLLKPDWLFLDEATASLDVDAEAHLYGILKQRLPNTTLVSIAHRPAVEAFHQHKLVFQRGAEGQAGTLAWSAVGGSAL